MHDVPRLHIVTPPGLDQDDLSLTHRLLEAGAPLVQTRTKDVPDRNRFERAEVVTEAARAAGRRCLVNDRVDIALATGADGVHVGAEDLPVAVARRVLGPDAIVGATCRNADDARRAQDAGASYVGVGPVYVTRTKAGLPDPMGPHGVAAVASAVDLPVIAISGVTTSNAPELLDAGAWGVAVVGALYQAAEPLAVLDELLEVAGCG